MNRIAIGTLLLLSGLATQATAASFTVTSTFDAVDAVPGDGLCATANGVCSLRAAVQEANASPGSDDVTLPAGVFALTVAGAGEDDAATGDLDVTQPLTLTGAGQQATIIDGVGADRVFHTAPNIALTVQALAIQGGTVAGLGGGILGQPGAPITIRNVALRLNRATSGGAVYADGAALSVTTSRFESNLTAEGAGALGHTAGAAALDIRDSVFADNVTVLKEGGAIAYGGTGAVTLDGVTFQRNIAQNGAAGFIGGASSFTMTDSVVEDGRSIGAGNGYGGITATGLGAATIDGVTVRRNDTDGQGGGLVVAASGAVTVSNSTFEDNTAGGGIGGLYVVAGADAVVQGTAVRRNRSFADRVGGVRIEAGSVTLRDAVVEGNTTLEDIAGAMLVAGANLLVERTRIVDNAALKTVGGMSATAGGVVTMRDSTVAGNQGANSIGGVLLGSNGGTIEVLGSTFAENLVSGTGGALVTIGSAPVAVVNSTFSANWAQTTGAGVLTSGNPVVIASSTFFGNVGGAAGAAIATTGPGTLTLRATVLGAGPFPSCAGAVLSDGHNLDQDGTCLLAGDGDRGGLEPELGPLQDNGGPTFTHEPFASSPLVDAFTGAACPASDQRGVARPTDGNGDGAAGCDVGAVEFVDECPSDPNKRVPGVCGCGVPDTDANVNGAIDCLINPELKARIATARALMLALTPEKTEVQKVLRENLTQQADDLVGYVSANEPAIVKADPGAKLAKLAKKARKTLRATRKGKGNALARKQTRANRALDALDGAVAP